VEKCVDVGVGERISVDLGGKSDAIYGGPIKNLEVYVKAITDGKFANMGPTNTGSEVNFGKAVRLQTGTEDGINIIVTQQGGVPLDDETWRHIGIQPERLDLLVIKSEIYYGEDDDHIASDVRYVNSPGLASMDLSTFEFNHITRPKFPIDTIGDDEYPN
jgi:microcystin degradation protein MlrC